MFDLTNPLVRELVAQLVEERFGDVLQAERQDRRDAEAEAEHAHRKAQMHKGQLDRLRMLMLDSGRHTDADLAAVLAEDPPATRLTVHPTPRLVPDPPEVTRLVEAVDRIQRPKGVA